MEREDKIEEIVIKSICGRIEGDTVIGIKSLVEDLQGYFQQELDKAREEGFDDGVERTVDIIQKGLDELLLEKGEEKYWVGDILRDCGYSVEKILPKNMKHYKSKLKDNK